VLKIVFFDWGGVLCESMVERLRREGRLPWTPARRRTIRELNLGRLSLVEAMRRLTRGTSWADRWDDLTRISLQHLMSHRRPDVWALAGLVRGVGIRTGILSNQSIEWACQIGALYNVQMIFNPMVFSALDSVRHGRALLKPHPAIFRHALALARVRPSEALLIDDSEENCSGAARIGIDSIRFESATQLAQELEKKLQAHKVPLKRGRPGPQRKSICDRC
jgi:FMN phosphatase YigB (HAD superfamily)